MRALSSGVGMMLAVLLASSSMACGTGMQQMHVARDQATDKGGLGSALNAPLAVGGVVRPAFKVDVKGMAAPSTQLISARPEIITVDNGLLVGKSPGLCAVLVAMEGGTVVDFIHVWVKQANRLDMHGIDVDGSDLGQLTEPVELLVGEAVRLVPHAYADSEQLVGVQTSTWTVEPPIAVVLREGLPNRVRVVAKAPGSATIKASMLGVNTSIKLTVLP